jgi:transcriptional regulator with GAF, ATPase, and Fis domain
MEKSHEARIQESHLPEASPGRVRANEVLRLILEGTVSETGRGFFRALARNLCRALQTHGAWVTEYLPAQRRLRSLAFWMGGAYIETYEYDIAGTPCEPVIAKRCLAHFPDKVFSLFPRDSDLERFGAVSYVGAPLLDVDGGLLGHLAALDTKPMPVEPHLITVFEIFAERAAAEYRRMRSEERLLEREDDLRLLGDEAEFLREKLHEAPEDGEILGRSAPMRELLGNVRRVAATDATVLILGETGTGKELVARSIHAASPRRGKPLVRLNCAAIPGSLMESELFGHEKGAFTGATMRREGRFALADGGTIFLDEVGELPLDLQAKLLRILQEGEFEPLGSARTRKVDVRVIAATNRNLDEEVRKGLFRGDLYYRLNVVPITIPPLRERQEDIIPLAEHFLRKFGSKMGKNGIEISSEAMKYLLTNPWPGNVRELENSIERALALSGSSRVLAPEHFPHLSSESGIFERLAEGRTLKERMQAVERRFIVETLEKTGGRVTKAALLLDVTRQHLHNKIKKYKIATH